VARGNNANMSTVNGYDLATHNVGNPDLRLRRLQGAAPGEIQTRNPLACFQVLPDIRNLPLQSLNLGLQALHPLGQA
jgi:hypothetical protein